MSTSVLTMIHKKLSFLSSPEHVQALPYVCVCVCVCVCVDLESTESQVWLMRLLLKSFFS